MKKILSALIFFSTAIASAASAADAEWLQAIRDNKCVVGLAIEGSGGAMDFSSPIEGAGSLKLLFEKRLAAKGYVLNRNEYRGGTKPIFYGPGLTMIFQRDVTAYFDEWESWDLLAKDASFSAWNRLSLVVRRYNGPEPDLFKVSSSEKAIKTFTKYQKGIGSDRKKTKTVLTSSAATFLAAFDRLLVQLPSCE